MGHICNARKNLKHKSKEFSIIILFFFFIIIFSFNRFEYYLKDQFFHSIIFLRSLQVMGDVSIKHDIEFIEGKNDFPAVISREREWGVVLPYFK